MVVGHGTWGAGNLRPKRGGRQGLPYRVRCWGREDGRQASWCALAILCVRAAGSPGTAELHLLARGVSWEGGGQH